MGFCTLFLCGIRAGNTFRTTGKPELWNIQLFRIVSGRPSFMPITDITTGGFSAGLWDGLHTLRVWVGFASLRYFSLFGAYLWTKMFLPEITIRKFLQGSLFLLLPNAERSVVTRIMHIYQGSASRPLYFPYHHVALELESRKHFGHCPSSLNRLDSDDPQWHHDIDDRNCPCPNPTALWVRWWPENWHKITH